MSAPFLICKVTRMLRYIPLICMIFCFLPGFAGAKRVETDGFRYDIEPPSTWVTTTDYPRPAAPKGKDPVKILLMDDQADVAAKEHYSRQVAMPMNTAGLEKAAQLSVEFNPEYHRLVLHHLTVTRGTQHIDKLPTTDIKLVQREEALEQQMYVGYVTASLVVSDVRVGDVIDFAYSVHGSNPVFGDKYSGGYEFAASAPIDLRRVRVVSTRARPLHYRLYALPQTPHIVDDGDQREYVWERHNVPAFVDEGDTPSWAHVFPWLQLTEYDDWRKVKQWASPLYANMKATGEAESLAKQFRREGKTDLEAARLALDFVQNDIRYFGIELGESSHRPHPPHETLQLRYGDCKDKAVLLVALLQEMGIKAYPALVSAHFSKAVADWLPSPKAFDHVIVAADIKGQRYWLDGTKSYQAGPLAQRGFSRYGVALVIGDREPALATVLPPKEATGGEMAMQEEFSATAYNAPVQLTVTSRYRGDLADYQRYRLATATEKTPAEESLNYYSRLYSSVESVGEWHVNDDKNRNELVITERYLIHDFFQEDGGVWVAKLHGSAIADFVKLPKTVKRKTPLAVYFPAKITHEAVLHYPEPTGVIESFPIQVDDEAFAYDALISSDKKTFKVRNHYVAKKDMVDVSKVPSHLKMVRQVADRLTFFARSSSSKSRNQASQNVLDRLDAISNQ
jgi:transglutaminase-like putative cysteine protease